MIKKLLLASALILLILSSSALAQKNNKSKKKIVRKPTLISAGVVNGKAINLVKPIFPQAARIINIYGTVVVEIIIDEKGIVREAKAISGHGLLKRVSVKAALQSTFVPFKLSSKPIRVTGIIVYNYIPAYYNWLEIGYSIKDSRTWKNMPNGFEDQKAFFEIYQKSKYEDEQTAFNNLIASIEGKLSDDEQGLWLFRVGMILKEIQFYRYSTQENTENFSVKLDNLLLSPPEKLSQHFVSKLKTISTLLRYPELNTDTPLKGSRLNKELNEIEVMMPIFGR